MRYVGVFLAVLFGLIVTASTVLSQTVKCLPSREVTHEALGKAGGVLVGTGVANGDLLMVYVDAVRDWVLLASAPEGETCLIVEGTDWRDFGGEERDGQADSGHAAPLNLQ